MGMFNYVNFEMPCPKCGEIVRGFQTKDGHLTMNLVEIEAVVTMYSTCECGHWIELSRAPLPLDAVTPKAPASLEQAISIGFRIVGD
jgi:hypothetical protein